MALGSRGRVMPSPRHAAPRPSRALLAALCAALCALCALGLVACSDGDAGDAGMSDGGVLDCGGVLCDPNARCERIAGMDMCVCDAGYAGDGEVCEDVDECVEGTSGCADVARCRNEVGGFECACDAGYVGDGFVCEDVDECAADLDDCADTATCTNADGGFTCACNPGYAGDGRTCVDVDECADGTGPCAADATCTNAVGSFLCACLDGFAGSGVVCVDIDECTTGAAGCATDATCTNAPGSFACACNPGFEGDGLACEDIDECALGTAGCDVNATCTNAPGTFACACNPGYEGDGQLCEDVDECALEVDDCDDDATCTNEIGSFACACNPGFEGDGLACEDIDECALGTAGCGVNATCTNEPGTFLCACDLGYSGDGVECDPEFDIVLDFANPPTASQRLAFTRAEARWENLIVGDVPDFTNIASFCGVPAGTTVVDDLRIRVELVAIDGPGRILGAAGPRCVRDTLGGTRFLPATGTMRFDTADLASLEARGQLEAVILHEMGHVLGIGTGWDDLDLIDDPSCDPTCVTTPPLVDTRYTGADAVSAWVGLGGIGDVPIENSLGFGSSDSHWREDGDLATELMSPILSSTNAVSVVTLQSLEDLGYSVGPDSRADTFTLPLVAGPPPPTITMERDIDDGPVWEQTSSGGYRRIR
jgi:hypothetical protein